MNPETGEIKKVASPEEAKKAGLISIPDAELPRVKKMNKTRRARWAAGQLSQNRNIHHTSHIKAHNPHCETCMRKP